jgi:hypothetical protein
VRWPSLSALRGDYSAETVRTTGMVYVQPEVFAGVVQPGVTV